jgi:ferric-dicitrate binding protein FerR (iron transport regulator)
MTNQNGMDKIAAELQSRIDQFLNGALPEDGLAELDRQLHDRPEAIPYFLDYCQLHIDLAIDMRADQALKSFRERQQQLAPPVAAPIAPPPSSLADEPFSAPQGSALFGYSNFFAFGVAVCVVMLVTAAGLHWWLGASEQANRAPLASIKQVDSSTPSITSVQLGAGTTTLELASIGSVVVEGPADFRLVGHKRARLNHGRIKVHVTQESGRGFVVETPDGEVTDLGTEFGLEVADRISTGLVVFQGLVDLRVGESEQISGASAVNRLSGGDGVRFSKSGQLDRIMSVMTTGDGTFQLLTGNEQNSNAIITQVSDNIRTGSMKKFYEIVPGGMREDARAYVDRQEHEWNGLTQHGMPKYLVGADYVKPFNGDKLQRDLEVEVTLKCPARLFVIWDDRLPPPAWLKRDFERFGDRIGLDMGKSYTDQGEPITTNEKDTGPGKSIDQAFSVWEKRVREAGVVKLGATGANSSRSAMYGIAAVRLTDATEEAGN